MQFPERGSDEGEGAFEQLQEEEGQEEHRDRVNGQVARKLQTPTFKLYPPLLAGCLAGEEFLSSVGSARFGGVAN